MALLNTNTRYLHDNLVRYAERLDRADAARRSASATSSTRPARPTSWPCAWPGRTRAGRTSSSWSRPTTATRPGSSTSAPTSSPGPAAGGASPGSTSRRCRTTTAGPSSATTPRPGRSTRPPWDGSRKRPRRGAVRPRSSPRPCPASPGRSSCPAATCAEAYRHVRAAGGVCIADEVQVGFGRLGTHFWGFETQGVVPDIVVLGKPIGNGFPLAAVVTTEAIAASFDNGMEFFSTFGGNPVACAAGLAVLDVMEEERLQERARRVGDHLHRRPEAAGRTPSPHRRRPRLGALSRRRARPRPDDARAGRGRKPSYLVDRLRELGVLVGTDGPFHNVIKIRPPLCFSEADADLFTAALDAVLDEDPVRIG